MSPIYEFQCRDCEHRWERLMFHVLESDIRCPKCDGFVNKVISAPALQFKGTGFHSTDYKTTPKAEVDFD